MIGIDSLIDELVIKGRTRNSLHLSGIYAVADLLECSPALLLTIEGFGLTSLADLRDALNEQGLHLAGDTQHRPPQAT